MSDMAVLPADVSALDRAMHMAMHIVMTEPSCTVNEVATVFKVQKTSYYSMVKNGTAPVMPIMVGRRQRYRTADVRRALGIDAA